MRLDTILDAEALDFVDKVTQSSLNRGLEAETVKGIGIICCSEMGNITSAFPAGQDLPIFVWQNLGGCVDDSGGLLDYISAKKLSNLIIFGHYGCEVMEVGLRIDLAPKEERQNVYQEVIRRTLPTRQAMTAQFGDRFDKQVMRLAMEDFVLREVASLLKLPAVYNAAKNDHLRVHAWLWKPDTGEHSCFDPSNHSFWVLPED